jgi:hypothetical protein
MHLNCSTTPFPAHLSPTGESPNPALLPTSCLLGPPEGVAVYTATSLFAFASPLCLPNCEVLDAPLLHLLVYKSTVSDTRCKNSTICFGVSASLQDTWGRRWAPPQPCFSCCILTEQQLCRLTIRCQHAESGESYPLVILTLLVLNRIIACIDHQHWIPVVL